ncbi:hypothetical protein [Streptomyces sp. C10-9-1]|uniref:hypothetical protein n=1 Tax=Streptomyces sp. C10-9-1 TaxID=1859285 RepID=UPI003F4A3855
MPLPDTRAVTGTYTNPVTGLPSVGTVSFTPIPGVWTDGDGDQVLSGGGTVTLDASGQFSRALVCTDADGVEPVSGRYWRVEERIEGGVHRVRVFALPLGPGTPLDITEVVSASPGSALYTPVEGPAGPQGPAGPTGPEGPQGPAGEDGSEADAEAYTDAAVAAHVGAVDPHGDRAYGDATFATIVVVDALSGTVTTLSASVSSLDTFVQDCLARVAAIEQGSAFLTAVNTSLLNVASRHTLDGTNDRVGFHGNPAVARQTIAGSRSDGTALANLLAALHTRGDIDNQSTA